LIGLAYLAFTYRDTLRMILLVLIGIGSLILAFFVLKFIVETITAMVNAISAMRVRAIQAGKEKVDLSKRKLERNAYRQRLQQPERPKRVEPLAYQPHQPAPVTLAREEQEPLVRRIVPQHETPKRGVPGMPQRTTVAYREIEQRIKPGQLVVLVRANGSLRLGEWNVFKTLLVVGGSSSGKTVTMAEKVLGFVNGGGSIVPCDPHDAKEDSLFKKIAPLAPALYPGAVFAVDHADILRNMRLVSDILQDRVAGGDCSIPVMLIVEELNRLMRDRAIALGDPDEKILPQVVGNGTRRYGYKFIRNNRGTVIGYELNYDIIHKEPGGTGWTEVKVVRFIFESVASGVSLRKLTEVLNDKGIPTPYVSKGLRTKSMTELPRWQHRGLSSIIKDTTYYGELHYGKTKNAETQGRKRSLRQKTLPEEQIIIPVPAIVTRELWERANRRVPMNKPTATRNNKYSKASLLRGGFVRCAYCGYALNPRPKPYTRVSGELCANFYYECRRIMYLKDGKCPGCIISVDFLDNAVIEYVKKLLRDPSRVDKEIKRLLAKNPINKREQETLRANLSREMKKKDLSEKTVALLGRDLADLERQEQEARKDLATQQQAQQKRDALARRISEFHKQCQEWREELDTPELIPDLHRFYQEAIIFFGITVKVWRKYDKDPCYEIYTCPPAIVELLSLMTDRD
jgi:hypothetical protein